MSWVKIDDGMPENLKIEALSDAAFRAYVTSICYAARNLTDGFVSAKKAKEFAGRSRVIQELMPELWQSIEGGYVIHDYLAYNPTREEVLADRAKREIGRAVGGKARASGAERDEGGRFTSNGSSKGDLLAPATVPASPAKIPARPDPDPDPLITPPPAAAADPERLLRQRPNIFKLYEQLFGKGVTPLIADRLREYEESHSAECIEHCFIEAAESNARNVKLVYAILDRHQAEGCYAERPGRNGNRNGVHAVEPATPNYGVPYEPPARDELSEEERTRILAAYEELPMVQAR